MNSEEIEEILIPAKEVYNLKIDPGETKDISTAFPEKFEAMMTAYEAYAKSVGVIEMEEGYSAEGEVGRKSAMKILSNNAPYLLGVLAVIVGLFLFWRKRRKVNQ